MGREFFGWDKDEARSVLGRFGRGFPMEDRLEDWEKVGQRLA